MFGNDFPRFEKILGNFLQTLIYKLNFFKTLFNITKRIRFFKLGFGA